MWGLAALLLLSLAGCSAEPTITGFSIDSSFDGSISHMAASDLHELVTASGESPSIRIRVTQADVTGYRISTTSLPTGHDVRVEAKSEAMAAYALWGIAGQWGARWYHPEEPVAADLAIVPPANKNEVPAFTRRGFHEHTKHPLPYADYYLVPDPQHRAALRRYFRWLARNRQNMASFVLLKTVDLATWLPYIAEVVQDAHEHGVELGVVLSFADNQQNAARLLDFDGETDDVRIRAGIDALAAAGFDFVTLQLGTSEFTSPDAQSLLNWMDVAHAHAAAEYPQLELAAWIHITCGLKNADGEHYYHTPLQADLSWTVWPHTVMFYTVDHPAPVYGCADFGHQADFMVEAASQGRRQVFVPESAWWLGFDNNIPLALPITGWSRAYDISRTADLAQDHLLFTSGREWGYWQYDYFTASASWDADLSWEAFVRTLTPIFGDDGQSASAVLATTELQRRHFYEERPDLFFYVAGELVQDEIGSRANILARPTRPSFDDIWNLDAAGFADWEERDLATLRQMAAAYREIVTALPDVKTPFAYRENRAALELFALRLEHVVDLYSVLTDIHSLRDSADVDREQLRRVADARLNAARARSTRAIEIISSIEPGYRYPRTLLTAERDNPTVYPFGYLHEAHTGYFWTRRDEQLATFIDRVFDATPDYWPVTPLQAYEARGEDVEMLIPQNAAAGRALKSFIPPMLMGIESWEPSTNRMTVVIGTDDNDNDILDGGQAQRVEGTVSGAEWASDGDAAFAFDVSEESSLTIHDALFSLAIDRDGPTLRQVGVGTLYGQLDAAELVATMTELAGIDEAGAQRLLKGVYALPQDEPLPSRLGFGAQFDWREIGK